MTIIYLHNRFTSTHSAIKINSYSAPEYSTLNPNPNSNLPSFIWIYFCQNSNKNTKDISNTITIFHICNCHIIKLPNEYFSLKIIKQKIININLTSRNRLCNELTPLMKLYPITKIINPPNLIKINIIMKITSSPSANSLRVDGGASGVG